MWVFLNNAFLSIVRHRTKPQHLLVRSRFPDDLARIFPNAMVETTPDADYRYRCTVTRLTVQRAMVAAVKDVTYPNFKNSVGEARRHQVYSDVWGVMADAKEAAHGGLPAVSTRPCDLGFDKGANFGGWPLLDDAP